MLTRFLGVLHHDRADLVGDLRAATRNQLIMYPSYDDNVAVPAVAEACAKLVANVDQPPFADHRLGARHRVVERRMLRAHGDATPVETRQPAMVHLRRELRAQLAKAA